MPKPKKSRKGTRAALAEESRKQAEAGPPNFGPFDTSYDPEFLEVQGKWYSVKELAEAVIAQKKKSRRKAGRPAIPRKFEILDAAALAKVQHGRYTQIAAKLKLSPRQLSNLVERNRSYFDGKVKSLLKNIGIKE